MGTNNKEEFVWGALLGSALGAAAALLLTPSSGAEIRSKVRHTLNHGLKTFNGKKIKKTLVAKVVKRASAKSIKKPARTKIKTKA